MGDVANIIGQQHQGHQGQRSRRAGEAEQHAASPVVVGLPDDRRGEAVVAFSKFLAGKASFRRSDLVLLLQECGVEALPIVALISFLVGLILAFVGALLAAIMSSCDSALLAAATEGSPVEQLEAAVRPGAYYYPRSRLVMVENTHNAGGGTVWPLEQMRAVTNRPLIAQANAGLPELVDGQTCYPLQPADLRDWMRRFIEEDGIGLIGGCCGTTPDHIAALDELLRELACTEGF